MSAISPSPTPGRSAIRAALSGPDLRAGAAGPGAVDVLRTSRPAVGGKFLYAGDSKLYVCGVTYGPFGPDGSDCEYGDPARACRDFAQMIMAGVNAVRTYSVPPLWLLDAAGEHGLRVMVGLPWEQHVAFLGDRRRSADIRRRVVGGVRACAAHPALLAFAIGNEIPAPIVRWYGHRRIEHYLRDLYGAAKDADP